jgi:DNA-binding protein HU-beta
MTTDKVLFSPLLQNLYQKQTNMNKADLINSVSEMSGMNKSNIKRVLEATVKALSTGLSSGDKVLLTGFGSFNVVERGPRTGINPKTLKAMDIPAKKFIKFTPGKDISTMIH